MPLGIFQGQREQRAFRRLFLAAPVFFAFPLIFFKPPGLPSATWLFFPMVFLLSLAFFDPPQEEICSLRIHNGVNFIFTASGREKGDSFFRWS